MNTNKIIFEDLPNDFGDKKGWPWTETSKQQFGEVRVNKSWPKISIITPSYNQAQYLEETIRSVLLQGYPNLEYIVIDGGSNDGSEEIIKKYEPWLTYWESEKDKGQSHAINKGFAKSTGEILAWINSDDYYMPGAFFLAADAMTKSDWVTGKTILMNSQGENTTIISAEGEELTKFDRCFKNNSSFNFRISQPSHFWSREMIENVGLINEGYHFGMDFDWMMRAMALGYQPTFIDNVISCIRYHPDTKTSNQAEKFALERARSITRLGLSGKLKLFPSIKLARFYYARYLRGISDRLFDENRKSLSVIVTLSAWLITSKKIGENYYSRLKRVLQ